MTTTHDPTTLYAAAESLRAITGVVTVDVIDYDTRLDRPALELCVVSLTWVYDARSHGRKRKED